MCAEGSREEEEEEPKEGENAEENKLREDQLIPRSDLNLNDLENFCCELKRSRRLFEKNGIRRRA